jgi:hypothetical protein
MLKSLSEDSKHPEAFNVSSASHDHAHAESSNTEASFHSIFIDLILRLIRVNHANRFLT